jgi:hypothetical protein
MNGENATMNGKSHMKKSIETERLLLLFFNYRFTGDYSYIPEKD